MEWREHSNESLIAYAASHLQHQGIAAMEMQRRHLEALREFSEASSRQAVVMIRLTWAIAVLTLVLTVVGVFQVWSLVR
jgi:type IV secretory pathway component VirB8